jgi:hypothetical protein
MLRGCLLSLGFLLALIAGYFYWLDQVFEPPGSVIAAGVVGFLVLCCLGALNNARTAWGDAGRAAGSQYDVQLVDGQLVSVSGPIHPVREPLLSPFSHTPCVLCEYDVASRKRVDSAEDPSSAGSDYAGFLMVPSVIRGPLGPVKLLGFPVLEGFVEETCGGAKAVGNARAFLAENEFEDRTGMKIVSVLSALSETWCDDDGLVRKNMRLRKTPTEELLPPESDAPPSRPAAQDDDDSDDSDSDDDSSDGDLRFTGRAARLSEKLVPVGTQVCAIGVYSEMHGGLVPPGPGGPPNRLLRGTAEEVAIRSRASMRSQLLGGLIGLAVIHGAILGVMYVYQHAPDVLRDQRSRAERAVLASKLEELAPLVRRGLDVNFQDDEGRTLLMKAVDPAASAWLLERGADVKLADKSGETALTFAARHGRTEIVRQLIAAQAPLNPRSLKTERTPLGEADQRNHDETAEVLRKAGALE